MTGAIRFREPKLQRMHNGNLSLELTEAGTWESFEKFAERWVAQVGAEIHDRFDAPDIKIWRLSYEGSPIRLIYNDHPNGVSVEATDSESNAAIEKLFSIVSAEASPNGV
jgi:hypothetical protein